MNIYLKKCGVCKNYYDVGEKCPYCLRERLKEIEEEEDARRM